MAVGDTEINTPAWGVNNSYAYARLGMEGKDAAFINGRFDATDHRDVQRDIWHEGRLGDMERRNSELNMLGRMADMEHRLNDRVEREHERTRNLVRDIRDADLERQLSAQALEIARLQALLAAVTPTP